MKKLSCSVVFYKHSVEEVLAIVNICKEIPELDRLIIVDNSPVDSYSGAIAQFDFVDYLFAGKNLGYGAAHNRAFAISAERNNEFHLVLNPDIFFEPDIIGNIIAFMEDNSNIGLVMPKVLYNKGEIQYLCKRLPTPFDLFARRFVPKVFSKLLATRLNSYELRHKNYDEIMDVPNLSGCFMFITRDALKKTLGFDERFFMYFEDVDLVRRINEHFRTVYYPRVTIFHGYQKGSYKSMKLLVFHLKSSIIYFNKWGWFWDKRRRDINGALI